MVDTDLVREYLKMESEGDEILAFLIDAAKEDLAAAGVKEPVSESKRYTLLVSLHVSLYSENRDPSVKIDKLNKAYESLLLRLKNFI